MPSRKGSAAQPSIFQLQPLGLGGAGLRGLVCARLQRQYGPNRFRGGTWKTFREITTVLSSKG
jgi:hypothetical protein